MVERLLAVTLVSTVPQPVDLEDTDMAPYSMPEWSRPRSMPKMEGLRESV